MAPLGTTTVPWGRQRCSGSAEGSEPRRWLLGAGTFCPRAPPRALHKEPEGTAGGLRHGWEVQQQLRTPWAVPAGDGAGRSDSQVINAPGLVPMLTASPLALGKS